MEHTISRYEKNLNHEGDVVSIFLAVNVNDGKDGACFEHWLSRQEMVDVLKDEANLKPILEECFAEAEIKLENEVATRPMPSIFPLREQGKKEQIETSVDKSKIAIAKAASLTEKVKPKEVEKTPLIENRIV